MHSRRKSFHLYFPFCFVFYFISPERRKKCTCFCCRCWFRMCFNSDDNNNNHNMWSRNGRAMKNRNTRKCSAQMCTNFYEWCNEKWKERKNVYRCWGNCDDAGKVCLESNSTIPTSMFTIYAQSHTYELIVCECRRSGKRSERRNKKSKWKH